MRKVCDASQAGKDFRIILKLLLHIKFFTTRILMIYQVLYNSSCRIISLILLHFLSLSCERILMFLDELLIVLIFIALEKNIWAYEL